MKHVRIYILFIDTAEIMFWCRQNGIPAVLVGKERAESKDAIRFLSSRQIKHPEDTDQIILLGLRSFQRVVCIRDCDYDLALIRFPYIQDYLL